MAYLCSRVDSSFLKYFISILYLFQDESCSKLAEIWSISSDNLYCQCNQDSNLTLETSSGQFSTKISAACLNCEDYNCIPFPQLFSQLPNCWCIFSQCFSLPQLFSTCLMQARSEIIKPMAIAPKVAPQFLF